MTATEYFSIDLAGPLCAAAWKSRSAHANSRIRLAAHEANLDRKLRSYIRSTDSVVGIISP